MNILVTGGTGFIGSHLVERLRNDGHRVRCVSKDRLNVAVLQSLNAEIVIGDLNNGIGWDSVLDGIDCIYHVAGVTRAQKTQDYYTGNHLATRRLVDVLLEHKFAGRLVYVSSLTVNGPSRDGNPVTEETPCRPVSEYGKSKMLAEGEVMRAKNQMAVTIVRPAAVYGPRERDLLEYIQMARRGFAPIVGLRTQYISMIHVHDLVDGIVRAGTSDAAIGQVYVMGNPEINRTSDIGRAVANAARHFLVQIPVPHFLTYAIGGICQTIGAITGKPILFNVQKARESVQHAWTCSSEKARRDLEFRPAISLTSGMRSTYRWYQERSWSV